MAHRKVFTRRLAAVLLAGPWTIDALIGNLKKALQPSPPARWIAPLARRILARFDAVLLPPTQRQLVDLLNHDPLLWEKICEYEFEAVQNELDNWLEIDGLAISRPQMIPGRGIPSGWNLPELVTPGEVADWLSVSPSRLDWLADCFGRERFRPNQKLRHYRYRWQAKPNGRGRRLIEEPKPLLKSIQRRILKEILNRIPTHEAAHAFRPGRSVLTYVKPHVGQQVVLHLDLRHFFPSIRAARVRSLFRWAGYPEAVANLLTGLCTNSVPAEILDEGKDPLDLDQHQQLVEQYGNPHLPQGAPTSPALANLAAYRLDCRLSGLARKAGANYSRYADDLVFSGGYDVRRSLGRFRILVCAIVLHEGFEIRRRKTRVMTKGTRQEVAGLVLNQRPNLRRDDYDRLRAVLFNCIRYGPESQNFAGRENFQAHLAGRIAYHAAVNPSRGAKLRQLFEQIAW